MPPIQTINGAKYDALLTGRSADGKKIYASGYTVTQPKSCRLVSNSVTLGGATGPYKAQVTWNDTNIPASGSLPEYDCYDDGPYLNPLDDTQVIIPDDGYYLVILEVFFESVAVFFTATGIQGLLGINGDPTVLVGSSHLLHFALVDTTNSTAIISNQITKLLSATDVITGYAAVLNSVTTPLTTFRVGVCIYFVGNDPVGSLTGSF